MMETDVFIRPDHLIGEEARMYCNTLRRFVDKEVLPHERELDEYWDWTERKESTFVHELFRKLWIDLGLQKIFVPPPYGGMGGFSSVEMAAIMLEISRGDHGLAESGFISGGAVAFAGMPVPNDTMLKKFASLLLGDEPYVIASALTEPHGGGAVEDMRLKGAQIRTRARLEGEEWVINGHKLWPSGYREARMFAVVCSIENRNFPDNMAIIAVPADIPGVSTGKPYQKMGTSLDTNGDIWFENARVPREYCLQQGENAVKALTTWCCMARGAAAQFGVGAMRRAYEILKQYVDNRETAGRPMKEHGAIVNELGQIASDMVTAEMFLWSTLERLDRTELYGPPWEHRQLALAGVCDNVVTECAFRVINRGLELMGSFGYSKEGKIEKLLRDVKIAQIVVGGRVLRLVEAARYYFGTETI
jgi:alkylation response protein AidB-like acyl-CoA dehydrogenase